MGVRCDRDDLAFFPNIYNEDWFFFSEEAARRKIAKVGVSQQEAYDPYEDPLRAAQEEFGDLLTEGLYARLDIDAGILGVDPLTGRPLSSDASNFTAGSRMRSALAGPGDSQ